MCFFEEHTFFLLFRLHSNSHYQHYIYFYMEEKVKMKAQIFRRMSLVLCAAILCAALGLAILLPTTALAYKDGTSPTDKVVNEIFNDNETTGGTFDKDNLGALLTQLGMNDGSNLEQRVANYGTGTLQSSSSRVGTGTPTRDYNQTKQIASQGIIVEFGGIKWLAAFLSMTNDGKSDVVLTLWQAEVTNVDSNKATWCDTTTSGYGTSSQNTEVDYPANMYGTSKIRAVTLNNGGTYSTSATTTTEWEQSKENKYAKFNMDEYVVDGTTKKSNISQYLVAPRYLDWQKEQVIPSGWNWTEQGKALNNQHWGKMGKSSYYDASRYPYYEEKTNYAQWADDLIWLPSCAEVGNEYKSVENSGIWLTSKTQRSASDIVWLRTASAF